MADQGAKRPGSILWIAIAAIVILAGVVFFALTRGGEAPASLDPPELGRDTAQVSPPNPNGLPPVSSQTSTANPSGGDIAPGPDQIVAPASAGASDVSFRDESLIFHADLPEEPTDDPVLAYLRRDAIGYLNNLKPNARTDFDRLKRAGVSPDPWEVRMKWEYVAKANGIVSLAGEASEYVGGAHPMLRFDTLIARAATGERLSLNDMLILKRSPSPALMIAMCEALKTEKIRRIRSATVLDEPIVCAGPEANAKTEDAKLALAPSDQANRFGGVYAYYEPYAVGAYAEGPYRLTVQQDVFAEDLRPEFRLLFAGEAPVLED